MADVPQQMFQAIDQSSFRHRLNNSRSNGEFGDVCLRVDNSLKIFKAHQVILAAASDILTIEDKFSIKEVSELGMLNLLEKISRKMTILP